MLLTAAPFDAWTVKRYHIVMRIAEPNVCIPDVVTGVKVCCRCCLIDWLDLLAWTVGMTCCTVVHLSAVQHDLGCCIVSAFSFAARVSAAGLLAQCN